MVQNIDVLSRVILNVNCITLHPVFYSTTSVNTYANFNDDKHTMRHSASNIGNITLKVSVETIFALDACAWVCI